MTAPLRPILADILADLALVEPMDDDGDRRADRLCVGAETLRWTHEYEDGDEALRERIADLLAEVEALECSESELTDERDEARRELAKCRKEISEAVAA